MQKKIHTQFLRNPMYILGCYLLLLLPEFINLCNDHEIISPFWNIVPVCSKQFVFTTFLGNSIWSLILLVFVFEAYMFGGKILKMKKFPIKKRDWFEFQTKLLLIAGVSFSVYLLLTYLFEWSKNTLEEIDTIGIFYRTVFATYFGINGVLLLSSIMNKRNPLSQEIVANGPLGKIPLALHEIVFFEKVARSYFVHSEKENFRITSNLSVIEKLLSKKHFIRINRSAIVNISAIKSYSHWENEKYILLLNTGKEFVVTRKRIVELKKILSKKQ